MSDIKRKDSELEHRSINYDIGSKIPQKIYSREPIMKSTTKPADPSKGNKTDDK